MNRFSSITFVALIALLAGAFGAHTAHAADPGDLFSRTTVTLAVGQQSLVPVYGSGAGNLRLSVAAGSAGDSVRATLQGGDAPASWTARTGETVWGAATFPQQNGKLVLENLSTVALTATIEAFGIDNAPSFAEGVPVLTGVAQGAGIQSSAVVNAPTSGLYRFTLNAAAGSYQLRVDDGAILKTVVAGVVPSQDDTRYFLSAGVHTLKVTQNSAVAATQWSIGLAPVGGADALPSSEQTAQLGGGSFFAEERVPLQVAAAQAVNVRIAATGGANDSLTIELYNGATKVYSSSPVFGGEIAWGSTALVAGANALRVVAKDGNAAALSYAVTIYAVAPTPVVWEGTSYGGAQHPSDGRSQIQVVFPTNGLYRFTLGASAGRYQLALGGNYLLKTVTAAGVEFNAYVPAGPQTLTLVQDPAAAQTAWNVAVAATAQPLDGLPFTTRSGTLGGAGNTFRDEWIPVQVAAGSAVNVRIAATGAVSDAIQIEVYNGDAKTYTVEKVYGSEVFWANTALAQGKNLIHITTPEANRGQIGYDLTLNAITAIPTSWSGVSHGTGLQSMTRLNAPVDGTYVVTVTVESGAGQVQIDPATGSSRGTASRPQSAESVLRIPLKAGVHTFVFQQDAGQESTTWSIAAALRKADATQTARRTLYIPLLARR